MEKKYDLLIIGAGTAGYTLALKGGLRGLKVAIVEKDKVGGTCLNRGCIPTKIYAHTAHYIEDSHKQKRKGLKIDYSLDMKVLKNYKNRTVNRLVKGIEYLINKRSVDLINGIAEYDNGFRVNGEIIDAKNIVIATGSSPLELPSLPYDGGFVINSDHALDMEEIPNAILIVGAGVIGLEFASIFSSFGSKVYVVELMNEILPGIGDKETKDILFSHLKKQGIKFYLENTVEKYDTNTKEVILKDGTQMTVDKILVAVGRKINGNSVSGIDSIVETDRKGIIKVDDYLQVSNGIYASGDVVGGPLLAHKASYDGDIILHNILNDDKIKADYSHIPSAVFTSMEYAVVGKVAEDNDTIIGRFPYAASGRAGGEEERNGMVKIFADKNSHIVLGGIVSGRYADMIIGEISLAVRKGLKLEDIEETVHIHPTYGEMVHEAVSDALGFPLHKE